MESIPLAIPDVKLLVPRKHGDDRGFFSETYNRQTLVSLGIDAEFVQDNHSLSASPGVIRGLHYQLPPMAQAKLVRVVRGAVLDVAVDLRRSSPTFGQHVSALLSAENWRQMYVPIGFAHGFSVLQPDTEVIYKVTSYYSPPHERGIRFDDPTLAIDWNVPADLVTLSARDRAMPLFDEVGSDFE